MSYITVENLGFSYENNSKKILEELNLEVDSGEFVCILGKSGCGKSTLLRLLSGLETPTYGTIKLDDKVIKEAGLDRAVVFQDYGLFPWFSAGDNISLALKQKYPDKSKSEIKNIAMEALKSVGLEEDIYNKLPKELSGGMQQRCAIAQAFSLDSPVLLMDEPFGAIDAVTRANLQELIIRLYNNEDQKKTVFFVTHDVDEAILLANRIVVLGQSPSKIIFDLKLDKSTVMTRENQFSDQKIIEIRNLLIKKINEDISNKL
ncbi:sulfonate ABC transporter ATP-binding protein [Finegoldia magna]|uniref:ABC transporter ATP-binding protein n=1 Tax=Finegoldia magna TaxID=1260 RepID=UPI000B919E64|nr:ABC transporter ATP-binding protein [Finegoldia magna]OXZ41722.1 sulfonate ABC transporter ATP-binding protein [Finegoldia magna]